MWKWIIAVIVFILILVGVAALIIIPSQSSTVTSGTSTTTSSTGSQVSASSNSLDDLIKVTAPLAGTAVTSPLTIGGQARGSWFFEASAPIALLDSNGSVIAQGTINDQGDWTSNDYAAFSGSLTFPDQPAGSTGTLVLTNDNPSGDPANQKTLDIPVTF